MDLLNQVLQLFVRFATIGGDRWLVWGAVTCGGLHRSHAQHDRRRGACSVTARLLSQAPETWNPALYQLAVNVHDGGQAFGVGGVHGGAVCAVHRIVCVDGVPVVAVRVPGA